MKAILFRNGFRGTIRRTLQTILHDRLPIHDMSAKRPLFHRAAEIARLTRSLEEGGYPRLQMSLLVSITGGAGFLASFLMLRSGLVEMWLRYLCAFGIAYLVFLLLLWLWLRTSADDYADAPDLASLIPSPSNATASAGRSETPPLFSGKGGTADGGGASGNFELADSGSPAVSATDSSTASDAFSAAADADELAIPLIVLLLLAALLLSSFWIIYTAPVLFAELLVDGILAASLYRRLNGLEAQHWMLTAIGRTLWPFVLTAALFSAAGWWMQHNDPGVRSIGDVMHRKA